MLVTVANLYRFSRFLRYYNVLRLMQYVERSPHTFTNSHQSHRICFSVPCASEHVTHTACPHFNFLQVFTDAVCHEFNSFMKLVLWTRLLVAILEMSDIASPTLVILIVRLFQTSTHILYVYILHTMQEFTDAVHQECLGRPCFLKMH